MGTFRGLSGGRRGALKRIFLDRQGKKAIASGRQVHYTVFSSTSRRKSPSQAALKQPFPRQAGGEIVFYCVLRPFVQKGKFVSFPRRAGGKGRLRNTARTPHVATFASTGRGERPSRACRNLDRQGEKAIASFATKSMDSYFIVEQVENPVEVRETLCFTMF